MQRYWHLLLATLIISVTSSARVHHNKRYEQLTNIPEPIFSLPCYPHKCVTPPFDPYAPNPRYGNATASFNVTGYNSDLLVNASQGLQHLEEGSGSKALSEMQELKSKLSQMEQSLSGGVSESSEASRRRHRHHKRPRDEEFGEESSERKHYEQSKSHSSSSLSSHSHSSHSSSASSGSSSESGEDASVTLSLPPNLVDSSEKMEPRESCPCIPAKPGECPCGEDTLEILKNDQARIHEIITRIEKDEEDLEQFNQWIDNAKLSRKKVEREIEFANATRTDLLDELEDLKEQRELLRRQIKRDALERDLKMARDSLAKLARQKQTTLHRTNKFSREMEHVQDKLDSVQGGVKKTIDIFQDLARKIESPAVAAESSSSAQHTGSSSVSTASSEHST